MLALAEVGPGDVLCDLGCGDGRIAIAAARLGAYGVGVDIEPYWIEQARGAAAAAGVEERTRFEVADATAIDLAGVTVATLYLVEWSTELVGARLLAELAPGARIVAHSFALRDAKPIRSERWIDADGSERNLRLWVAGATPPTPSRAAARGDS